MNKERAKTFALVEDADRAIIGSKMTDYLLRVGFIEPTDGRQSWRIFRLTEAGKKALKEASR